MNLRGYMVMLCSPTTWKNSGAGCSIRYLVGDMSDFYYGKKADLFKDSINSCLFLGITCMYLSSRWAKQI